MSSRLKILSGGKSTSIQNSGTLTRANDFQNSRMKTDSNPIFKISNVGPSLKKQERATRGKWETSLLET